MRICPKCDQKDDDVNFSCVCGNDLRDQSTQNRNCPHCGFSGNNANNAFCGKCGKKLKEKNTKNNLFIGFIAIVILLIVAATFWFYFIDRHVGAGIKDSVETQIQISNKLKEDTEPTVIPSAEDIVIMQEETFYDVNIDMECNHIFEVFTGKNGIETNCRFCGVSPVELFNAGIDLSDVDCEHNYEKVIQTNGTPAYECKSCHKIVLYNCPPLTDLKLLSDTNAEGKNDDIKYGTFYHNGWEWQNAIRFWVADKSGYTNTESLEVYLANAYTELYIVAFASKESDDNTDMTLRFYGDGQLLYEMTDITKDSEEKDTKIDVTDVEILKVECLTEMDAFGYCILHGTVY